MYMSIRILARVKRISQSMFIVVVAIARGQYYRA